MANTDLQTFYVHIHPDRKTGSLPPNLWNACVAEDRHSAIVAVLRAYDAQEYQPTTVYTLLEGASWKNRVHRYGSGIEVEAMKYGSARLAIPSDSGAM